MSGDAQGGADGQAQRGMVSGFVERALDNLMWMTMRSASSSGASSSRCPFMEGQVQSGGSSSRCPFAAGATELPPGHPPVLPPGHPPVPGMTPTSPSAADTHSAGSVEPGPSAERWGSGVAAETSDASVRRLGAASTLTRSSAWGVTSPTSVTAAVMRDFQHDATTSGGGSSIGVGGEGSKPTWVDLD